jgi:hypothetical protein
MVRQKSMLLGRRVSLTVNINDANNRHRDPLSTLSEAAGNDSKNVGHHVGLSLTPMHFVKSTSVDGTKQKNFEAYTSDALTNGADEIDIEMAFNLKSITPVSKRATTVSEAQRRCLEARLKCGEGLAEPMSPVARGAAHMFLGFVQTVNGTKDETDQLKSKPGGKKKRSAAAPNTGGNKRQKLKNAVCQKLKNATKIKG